ncbi:carboxylesterase/lipase family protein [Mycobacterium sp. 852002-51057_SCH5723018]|uniref:carboxylesterase/lipase family protein n=1 Tax=Mycobacterium sp. 852002-51057_SCH5723018 TaxID=1834094 RepID=UPI0007FDADE6|nr:carboxylesterase/lipase family protein [Mycobacterium sp. 852002-51057_SCH5723018]OBG19708.1 carboxylesterase [Mycobacterium sp. 852002-51057_SCH5723018]
MTHNSTVVETAYGPVRGADHGHVRVWKGIRYAAPPVGDLRWRAPQPPKRWTEVVDASAFGPVCPQPTLPVVPLDLGAPPDEDCLSLNIWVPSTAGDAKPVMVWLHGGAYVLGSGSQPLYDGSVLASNGDTVVVTINYRLNAFGFLDLSSFSDRYDTNLGLRDVISALRWVRDNIAEFGGNPNRVTIFGESAGAGIVTTLLSSPAAEGLFVGAIAQSSPATSVYDPKRTQRITELFLKELGVEPGNVDRLREVPANALVTASQNLFEAVPMQTPGTRAFAPMIDGDLVPEHPVKLARTGRSLPVPLIIGTNRHEAALFRWMKSPLMPITPPALKAMFAEIASEQPELVLPTEEEIGSAYEGLRIKARGMAVARDLGFRMPSVWLAEGHSTVAPAYLYRFDFATPMLRLLRIGAAHATELPYVWGNLSMGPKDPTFKLGGLKAGQAVSKRVQARWLNFAAHGKPLGLPDEPAWIPYQEADRACLVIGRTDTVVNDLDRDIRPMWGDKVLNFR